MNRALATALLAGASPRPMVLADFLATDRTRQAEAAWQAELKRRAERKA